MQNLKFGQHLFRCFPDGSNGQAGLAAVALSGGVLVLSEVT